MMALTPEFTDKLTRFMVRLEQEMNAKIERDSPILNTSDRALGRRGYHEIDWVDGMRFVKVIDVQRSQTFIRYFVERDSGIIFGAAGYKKYNPNHEYGTLDTIDEWNWEGYYAVSTLGKESLVPKHLRK
jgi:hypothetical protein